jgi:hypothetical protein
MEKKPNGCMINQKIKTYLTRQPKMQASTKKNTKYSKNIAICFVSICKLFPFVFNHGRVPPRTQGNGRG